MIHHIIVALSGNVFYVAFDLDRWVPAVVNHSNTEAKMIDSTEVPYFYLGYLVFMSQTVAIGVFIIP